MEESTTAIAILLGILFPITEDETHILYGGVWYPIEETDDGLFCIKVDQDAVYFDIWHSIDTAPKDGTEIEVANDYELKEVYNVAWSERPVCMLGSVNGGFPPGWATPYGGDTDSNLPCGKDMIIWRNIA